MPEIRLVITCDCPSVGVGGRSYVSGVGNSDVERTVSGNHAVELIFDQRPRNAVPDVALRRGVMGLTASVRANSHLLRLPTFLFRGLSLSTSITQAIACAALSRAHVFYRVAIGDDLFDPRQLHRVANVLALSAPNFMANSVAPMTCKFDSATMIGSKTRRKAL